jgi:hypothetical protein
MKINGVKMAKTMAIGAGIARHRALAKKKKKKKKK